MKANFDLGSNCPIVSESKALLDGDVSKAGLLSMYTLSAGAAINANVKIGVANLSKGAAMA